MASGNAARRLLSFVLVGIMVLPVAISLVQISGMQEFSEERDSRSTLGFVFEDHKLDIGEPDHFDPSHGWESDGGNIGEAALFHRTATYVPIQDWTQRTGEKVISGWHTLGHEYPVPSHWKSDLDKMGIECKTFYSPQGFHCDVPKLTPSELMDAGVIGAFRLDPTDKLAPDVLPLLSSDSKGGAIMEGDRYVMNLLLSGDGLLPDLEDSGIEVIDFSIGRLAKVIVDDKLVGTLIAQPFVEWIEPSYPDELDNGRAGEVIGTDWVADSGNMGSDTLSGNGVIVAVMDSGLDEAVNCNSIAHCNIQNSDIHPDFYGRLHSVITYTCSTCTDGPEDYNGHGTHVAGSAVGSGVNSAGVDADGNGQDDNIAGTAPGALMVFQGVDTTSGPLEEDEGGLYNPGYTVFFQEAYDKGARVHTNSWGSGPDRSVSGCAGSACWNYYDTTAQSIDTQANTLTDLTILYAMGNDAFDCNYDAIGQTSCTGGKNGEINTGAMNKQATAKNILSIGASENNRPEVSQQWQTMPFRTLPSVDKFGTPPIAADKVANNPEGMAGFSNRGPTNDNRIKPDLVAPGTYILSTRSSLAEVRASDDWGDYYTFKSGTSMATPLTAGTAALLIEHLNNVPGSGYNCDLANNPTSDSCPESALVKAILIAGAHEMLGQYSTGGDGANGAKELSPNLHEGWGRVDIQNAVGAGFSEGTEITTGESHSFMLTIPDTGLESFRVALVWNDPVNSPSAGKQLINDLDITLKDPYGNVYPYSNDDLNNVVGVTVRDFPDAGDWEVIVSGTNVAQGPSQKYYVASSTGIISDMRHPVSDGLNEPGFQSGSIFTETTMSAGEGHLCAIFDDTTLQCWGDNSAGQLGDGTTVDRLTMTPVSLDQGRTAVSISSGKEHTCSTLDNGEVRCWGKNDQGQLGDGSNTDSSSPVLTILSGVPVQISAGGWHTCAILNDASLECWGNNDHGQLGDGSNSDSSTPVSVGLSGKKALAVSAGANHTCAVLDDWSLACWGSNDNGQLGDGSTTPSSNTPVPLPAIGGDVVAVSSGGSHTCALLDSSKTLKCWGGNSHGQLGQGGTNQQNDASTVTSTLTGVTSFDSGEWHTCAIDTSRSLHCWGRSSEGQIGDGSTSAQVSSATEIGLIDGLGAISVTSGHHHTCVVASNDLPQCWGGDGQGQLSQGTSPSTFSLPRWTYMASSERDLNDPSDGEMNIFEVRNVGDSDGDGFASGADSDDSNPTVAADCTPGNYGRFSCRDAAPGYYVPSSGYTVMIPASPGNFTNSDGASLQTQCGPGTFQELPAQTSCDPARAGYFVSGSGASKGTPCPAGQFNNLTGQISADSCNWAVAGHSVPVLTRVSAGALHTCSILDDGSVSCWGENSNGQLGDGTRTGSSNPQKASMPLGRSAIEISTGSYHTCALMDDSSVRCWGSNEFGQLGDGTTIEKTTPVSVDLGHGALAVGISSGEAHSCAVLENGTAMCWGENSNGQLGDGTRANRNSPVEVFTGGILVNHISAGSYHTCAILEDRSAKCWGDNWHGQLGDGSTVDRLRPRDVAIPGDSDVVSLDAGPFHTCSGLNDGSLYCWGFNGFGQLGVGDTVKSPLPANVAIDASQTGADVQTGLFHSCALYDSGEVACWGDNSVGQLGDGTLDSQILPNLVSLPTSALSISVGQRHTCAILDDASLECWGLNSLGQLGDGTSIDRTSPVAIDLGHGSKEQVPCSPGSYQPQSQQTTCLKADRGFSVPDSGQLNQTGCTKGYFSSLKGQPQCTIASFGFYVDVNEAVAQTQCPALHSTISEGSTSPDMCLADFDGDHIPDTTDLDDDNDGVPDDRDFDPLDPNVSVDSDGDQIPDSLDSDDDNDGVNDTEDLFPYDQTEWKDVDLDGIGDNEDQDDDGDGRDDMFDVFPEDNQEWSDFDGDAIGDNRDPDDDNDGKCDGPRSDYEGMTLVNVPPSVISQGPDIDEDGIAECAILPLGDAFPLDPSEWYDTDGDSIGNENDTDDDNDGFNDTVDAFQLDASEWSDLDGDNIGDNRDLFPNDSTEWQDTDGDTVGDNADKCPYLAGISSQNPEMMTILMLPGNDLGCPIVVLPGDEIALDEVETVMEDTNESSSADFDGDGIKDLFDTDDDNDGIPDSEDGRLDPSTGWKDWSKDPTRPLGGEAWMMIAASTIFLGLMGYRIAGLKKRDLASIRSKRIRIQ